MKRIRMNGRVAEDGSLILPPGVLESIEAQPGSLVCMEYVSGHLNREINGYGTVLKIREEKDQAGVAADEEAAELVVPHDLLEEAHIPLDSGLVVQVIPGAILIGDEDPMAAAHAPLLEILSLLGISEDEVYEAIEKGGYYNGETNL